MKSHLTGFTTANGLRIHIDHAHTELSEVHACIAEGCGKTFPRVRLLTFHMKKVHGITKAAAPLRDFLHRMRHRIPLPHSTQEAHV